MKKYRLTENRLRGMIREAVKSALHEGGHLYGHYEDGTPFTNSKETWRGVRGTTFISMGAWSDPEVWYDGRELNGTDLEDNAWAEYKYQCEEEGKEPSMNEYDNLPSSWFEDVLIEYVGCMVSENKHRLREGVDFKSENIGHEICHYIMRVNDIMGEIGRLKYAAIKSGDRGYYDDEIKVLRRYVSMMNAHLDKLERM